MIIILNAFPFPSRQSTIEHSPRLSNLRLPFLSVAALSEAESKCGRSGREAETKSTTKHERTGKRESFPPYLTATRMLQPTAKQRRRAGISTLFLFTLAAIRSKYETTTGAYKIVERNAGKKSQTLRYICIALGCAE